MCSCCLFRFVWTCSHLELQGLPSSAKPPSQCLATRLPPVNGTLPAMTASCYPKNGHGQRQKFNVAGGVILLNDTRSGKFCLTETNTAPSPPPLHPGPQPSPGPPSPPPAPAPPAGTPYAGLCVATSKWAPVQYGKVPPNPCLLLYSDGSWTFLNTSGKIRLDPTTTWVSLTVNFSANGTRAVSSVAGQPGPTVAFDHFPGRNHNDNSSTTSISINLGCNLAHFDNFSMSSI